MTDFPDLQRRAAQLAEGFAAERGERQISRELRARDFDLLADAGYLLVGVPVEQGGLWHDVRQAARPICEILRTLAGGDASLALVSAMHPAVLSYWLTTPAIEAGNENWQRQRAVIFELVRGGAWFGTITSEPGSGGDVAKTKTRAELVSPPEKYLLTGEKHFGSGSGRMSFQVTTAVADGESEPDWYFVDFREAPWDGSTGLLLRAAWDGHGMIATQSHAFRFEHFPATRIAWPGHLPEIARRCGPFINCLFSSVIVGIVEAALSESRRRRPQAGLRPFEQLELARAEMEGWLVQQAIAGMLRAVETQDDPRREVLQGKTAIAELAETLLGRLCKAHGGGSYARHSPLGFWFEDVRALGYLRPPWGLAFDQLIAWL